MQSEESPVVWSRGQYVIFCRGHYAVSLPSDILPLHRHHCLLTIMIDADRQLDAVRGAAEHDVVITRATDAETQRTSGCWEEPFQGSSRSKRPWVLIYGEDLDKEARLLKNLIHEVEADFHAVQEQLDLEENS